MVGVGKLVRGTAIGMGGLGVLVGGYLGVATMAASRLEAGAQQAWAARKDAVGDFASRYPTLAPNRSALELERMAAVMGLDLATAGSAARSRPEAEAQARFDEARSSVADYVNAALEDEGDRVAPPPEAVAALLAAHDATLSEMERHLLSAEPPVWERDLSLAFAAPIPNLLGTITLQRLLAARALSLAGAGRVEEAHAALTAARRHATFLEERPELVCVMVGVATSRIRLGVLRKVSGHEQELLEALAREDWRPAMLRSIECDAWTLQQFARAGGAGPTGLGAGRVADWLERPYLRASAASYAGILEDASAALSDADACSGKASRVDEAARDAIPFWNVVAKVARPEMATMWGRVTRWAVDAELTVLVLRARQAAAGGAWPESLAGTDSSACRSARYAYARRPDGSIRIALEATLPTLPSESRPVIPTVFVGSPPAAAAGTPAAAP